MTEALPVIDDRVRDAAVHGSWCPKLCSHACPVLAATGRDDAVPWSFHRTVADLVAGTIDAPAAADQLVACTGCLACQVPCVFDQDVPEQVRAGRAATWSAGAPILGAGDAVAAVTAGRSPYDAEPPAPAGAPGACDVTVLVGCRDDAASIEALERLYAAAGLTAGFVSPDGCCGGLLHDLGADDAASSAGAALAARLPDGPPIVTLDPHCAGAVADRHPTDVCSSLAALLDDGLLVFEPGDAGGVVYHDPCLLARAPEPVVAAPRRLLAAAGYALVEPEGTGEHTVCSGAGLGLELVDPPAAEAVAVRRRAQLSAAAPTVATACAGARRRLGADGSNVHDLLWLLAARLPRTSS